MEQLWRTAEPNQSKTLVRGTAFQLTCQIFGKKMGNHDKKDGENNQANHNAPVLSASIQSREDWARRNRQFSMPDAVGDDFDRQTLCITDRFLATCAVRHDARQFQCLRDPAAVIFTIKLNREIHALIVLLVENRFIAP